ncbi:MAG: glycosyltransferase family 4 protein [Cyanobacteria bacterium]|nr:glycosyltransferase family 4 protein [Cyanobacteriota bacterium]
MKIAVAVPGGLHPSGQEQVVPSWLALFERLAQSHELHAFALKHLDTAQSYALNGFTVHDLGRPSAPVGFTRWSQERALQRALEEHGPFDLIHGFYADPAGQLAARLGRRFMIPSVVTCDSGEFVAIPQIDYGSQRSSSGRKAVKEACTLASKVHVCTTFMGALAAEHNIKATVIPLTSVTSQAATIKRLRQRYPSDTFRIVQVASLSRVKNQRLLIDALSIVRKQIDAHLDLVGEDTLGGELQKHADAIGLASHVTFHGFLTQPRVLEVLSNADLYVQSSLHEAAGVSVLEAAAAGVPVLGTLAGYVADWSPTKAMALGDAIPESLADSILTLHGDADRCRSMAGLARTFSIAHDVTWSAMQFEKLYRSLKD